MAKVVRKVALSNAQFVKSCKCNTQNVQLAGNSPASGCTTVPRHARSETGVVIDQNVRPRGPTPWDWGAGTREERQASFRRVKQQVRERQQRRERPGLDESAPSYNNSSSSDKDPDYQREPWDSYMTYSNNETPPPAHGEARPTQTNGSDQNHMKYLDTEAPPQLHTTGHLGMTTQLPDSEAAVHDTDDERLDEKRCLLCGYKEFENLCEDCYVPWLPEWAHALVDVPPHLLLGNRLLCRGQFVCLQCVSEEECGLIAQPQFNDKQTKQLNAIEARAARLGGFPDEEIVEVAMTVDWTMPSNEVCKLCGKPMIKQANGTAHTATTLPQGATSHQVLDETNAQTDDDSEGPITLTVEKMWSGEEWAAIAARAQQTQTAMSSDIASVAVNAEPC